MVSNGRVTFVGNRQVPNQVDFVITTDKKLIIGKKHHFLGNRKDVLAAGMMKITGSGKIRRIDNLSGHYAPTVEEAMQFPKLLREMGFDLKGATFEAYHITDVDYVRIVVETLK